MQNYEKEAKERYSKTDAYKEFGVKTASYTTDKWQEVNDGLNQIFKSLASCLKDGFSADSKEAKNLIKELQNYITKNYYTCTDEILTELGKTYSNDTRFKENIDKYGKGTAEFVSKAIDAYFGQKTF